MILDALNAKIAPYALAAIGGLVVVGGLAFWWLFNERDQLLAENATKTQALSNAAKANSENLSTIKTLEKDIAWREAKAIERQQRNQDMANQLAATHKDLQEAMKDAPECVDQPWPDAVLDIMRRGTVADPNRNSTGEGAIQLRATDTDSSTAAPDRPVP